ncbi:MAG TPA: hypothetical protein VFE33_25790 [Thermoanaerobaculia bacterium]|nr:hypothetical protein [Thermoanaerobaculia bacterium]
MHVRRISLAAVLVAGLLSSLPVRSAESVAPQAAPAPATDTSLFTPAPLYLFGTQTGPCTVSVRCKNGATISCSGQGSCQWRGDNPPLSHGFVTCDGHTTDCPTLPM